jgi:hypothetical protein
MDTTFTTSSSAGRKTYHRALLGFSTCFWLANAALLHLSAPGPLPVGVAVIPAIVLTLLLWYFIEKRGWGAGVAFGEPASSVAAAAWAAGTLASVCSCWTFIGVLMHSSPGSDARNVLVFFGLVITLCGFLGLLGGWALADLNRKRT